MSGAAALVSVLLMTLVAVPAGASVTEFYRDSFASGGFSGSNGTVAWSTAWIESEGDGPDDGLIQVDNEGHCFEEDCLVLGKDNTGSATVEREVDLTDAITAELTFAYKVHKHGDGAGDVRLRVKPSGGSWQTLKTYPLGTDVGPLTETVNLLGYASDATRIRFDVSGSTDDSHINVDDVSVEWEISTNVAPVLDPVGDRSTPEAATLVFTATATDPNPSDSLTFSLGGSPPAGASMTPGGSFSWTPTESQGPGSYALDVVVEDDGVPIKSDRETITVTVTEVNTAPVLDPVGDKSTPEEATLAFGATASDGDVPANSITFSLAGGAPSGASITSGGGFTWTPSESQGPGSWTFDVVATDDGSPARSDAETITITVSEANSPPVLNPIGPQAVEQGTTLGFTASSSDADLPANALMYRLAGSVPSGASINPSSGMFSWPVPASQPIGDYTFDVVVDDDGTPMKTDRETITVTVANTNQAPVLSPISDREVDEGSIVSFRATASDPDIPSDELRFSLQGAPSGASIGSTSGLFTWVPNEGHGPGTYQFDVVVTDDAPVAKSDSERVTVTVAEVNQAPVLSAVPAQSGSEGEHMDIDVVASDPDLPENGLSFSLIGVIPAGASIDDGGVFRWVPSEGQGDQVHTISIRVTDDGSPSLSDVIAFEVAVTAANEPPTIEPIPNQTSDEGTLIELPVLVADPEGGQVTVDVTGLPPGLSLDPSSISIAGIVAEGAAGSSPYIVTITATDDDADDPLASVLEFSWTVQTVNTAPVGTPRTIAIDEDSSIAIPLIGIDPDDDNPLAFSISKLPGHATVQVADNVVTYRPAANWHGTDTFSYVVSDGRDLSLPATVTVVVRPVNDAPALQDDSYVVFADSVLRVEPSGVLENDVDVDGEEILVASVTSASYGELDMTPDGSLVYRPDRGFTGYDTFVYRVVDAAGESAAAEVVLDVRAAESTAVRSAIVGELSPPQSPGGDDGGPSVPVVERSLVLMSSAARRTLSDVGFPGGLLILTVALVLTLGRISAVPLIRRGRVRTGIVTVLHSDARYGLVSADDDPESPVFFHLSVTRPRNWTPEVETEVEFRAVPGRTRPVATWLREKEEGAAGEPERPSEQR